MYPPFPHASTKKLFRSGLALLLCLALAIGCCAVSAAAEEPSSGAAPSPESSTAAPAAEPETSPSPSPEATPTPAPSPEPTATPIPTPAPAPVTLTFRISGHDPVTLTVEWGTVPTGIPQIPERLQAQVLGWYDEEGNPADPANLPAERDAVYTARWGRQVSEVLNTDDHIAYIHGYENNMFRPDKNITRGEAASMFYGLLRNKPEERRKFTDVSDQWYAKAVESLGSLHILNGYSDGSFLPDRTITREEFVTIAIACDTLTKADMSFSDVSADSWAAPFIAAASSKGWISGFGDGTFHPGDNITRAQAVSIINRMLGRKCDPKAPTYQGVKNFPDVFPDHWAANQILEASVNHRYQRLSAAESWVSYDKSSPTPSGWFRDGGTLYYVSGETGKFLRGPQILDGKQYYMNDATGAAVTGFRSLGGWRRYFKNGLQMEDISGLGVVSGPYYIKVYKNSNYLILYAKDERGNYNTPVKAMRVSCGVATPTGTFYTPYRYRWLKMAGDTYAQWCTQIQGNYLFHSVPCWTHNNADLEVEEYNHLGETRSMGCVRLNCRDAKWIYDNCVLQTKVTITTAESGGPLSKPGGLQIPSWHTWDPTDPTAYWRCQQNGCH